MGIPALWNMFDSAKQSKSIQLLATEHRLHARSAGLSREDSTLILGIDMGTCMAECSAGASIPGVNYQLAGGGLYIFYKKLTEFIKSPIALVFVFDGPERPPVKQGREVRHQPIWWAQLTTELIEYFSYQVHHAPGEAEAELAQLNVEGHIHGVITSNSDAILFGSRLVLRSIPKREKQFPDEHLMYDATDGPPLTQGGLILFALLCSGDYGDGITGCGPLAAKAIAQCGFGDQLIAAFRDLSGRQFDQFLVQWRCSLRLELCSNSQGILRFKRPNLAAAVPDSFPNRRLLNLYVNPITSWSPGHNSPNLSQWSFTQPSISSITQFCAEHFRWQNPNTIKARFKADLWEGVFLQMLYSPSVKYLTNQGRLFLPNSVHADVLSMSWQKRQGQFARMFGDSPQQKLLVSTLGFVGLMGPAYTQNIAADQLVVWLPAAFLSLLPELEAAETHVSTNEGSNDDEDGWVQIGERSWYKDLTLSD